MLRRRLLAKARVTGAVIVLTVTVGWIMASELLGEIFPRQRT